METNFSLIHNWIVSNYEAGEGSLFDFLFHHIFWTFYILNMIFGVIAYKLGFAKELPLLKSIIVYILLAIGMFVVTIFSIAKLPMTETLIIISLVLGIYRYRLYKDRKSRKEEHLTE